MIIKHIAIIMDGNGRWAESRGLSKAEGHRRGAEAARKIIEVCAKQGIPFLTLYAFSAENWNRPESEVSWLMELLEGYLRREISSLHENNIRVRVIGDLLKLAPDIRTQIEKAESLTAANTRLTLTVALSYGSRQEIIQAAKKAAESGEIKMLDEEKFSRFLHTAGTPDPDLLIRTGGEKRLSNFLLWQFAYTELYFSDILWPDFGVEDLKEAIAEFAKRERRYGARPAVLAAAK